MPTAEEVKSPVTKRDRSPAYPFISLETAIERMTTFDAKFGRHGSPMNKAGIAWGYKGDSSQSAQTLSALKYYGLVEYIGPSDDRKVALTEEARNYLRAQQSSTKAEIAKSLALRPKAIQTYWAQWGADRPIDEVCLDQLILKDSFTESAAKVFLRVYDDTIVFAGLRGGDTMGTTLPDGSGNIQEPVKSMASAPKVGDAVRWESGGVIQFESRRILSLSADGAFAFVEGSATGLPVKELTVTQQATQSLAPSQPPAAPTATVVATPSPVQAPTYTMPPEQIGTKQDTFTLDEGPAVLQWPAKMSETSYEDFKDWVELQLRKIKRSIH
jgi:hypothetical protein